MNDNAITRAPQAGIVRETFASQEIQMSGETVASVLAARAKAEVEARFIMAMKRPRDMDMVRSKLLKACERPGFAGSATEKTWGEAWYKKPIGEGVEGFSIRFAEEALRTMGNMDARSTILFEDDEKRLVQVEVLDLENNLSIPTNIIINKTIERKYLKKGEVAISVRTNSNGEPTYLRAATEDEVMQKQNSLISKAIRNGVMRLLPGDIQAECRERILQIRLGKDGAKDPEALKRKIIDGFARHNIEASDLRWYLGHEIGKSSQAELAALRDLWKEIDEGKLTWNEVVKAVSAERGEDVPDEEPPAKGLEKIKQKARAKQAKPEPKPKLDPEPDNSSLDNSPLNYTDEEFSKLHPGVHCPVIIPEDEPQATQLDVFAELDARLKELYGPAADEKLKAMCKQSGFKGAMLKENEAGMLLDILNEGAAS